MTVPVLPGLGGPGGRPAAAAVGARTRRASAASRRRPAATSSTSTATTASGGEELVELDRHRRRHRGPDRPRSRCSCGSRRSRQLTVQSFAVVDTIDAGLTVDVAPHVTGTAGTMSLESVRVLDDAAATRDRRRRVDNLRLLGAAARHVPRRTSPSPTASSDGDRHGAHHDPARRCAAAAGDLARRRVRASAGRTRRSTSSRPSRIRRAACCCSATSSRHADDGATLSVDARRVRTTCASRARPRRAPPAASAPSRTRSATAPTIRARSVQGEATVFLLPPAPELAPIAVDDTVVVRAGSQIDIPVLENDIAPAGGRPTLNPGLGRRRRARRARLRVGRRAALPRPDRAGRVRDRLLRLHDRCARARRHGDRPRAGAAPTTPTALRCPRRSRAAC